MNIINIEKIPSKEYIELQQGTHKNGIKNLDNYDKLKKMFEKTFSLTLYKGHRPKLSAIIQSINNDIGLILDHILIYGKYPHYKIVTQPYVTKDEISKTKSDYVPNMYDLTEWAFYYPGHATCYMFDVDCNKWKLKYNRAEMIQ